MAIRRFIWGLLAALPLAAFGCGGPLPPPDPPYLAEAKDSLSRGNHWFERGCFLEAEKFYQKGLESARWSDQVLLIIRAQNSLGAAALARGRTDLAANHLERALELVQGRPDQPELDKVLANLAALAWKLGRAGDAEDFWRRAAESAGEKGLSSAPYQCDLARLYLETKRPEFPEMAAAALAAAEAGAPASVRADALNLAGHAALAAGDLAAAETHFSAALELDRQTENTLGLAQDTEALGRLALARESYAEAAGYFDRSFYLWLAVEDDRSAGRLLAELTRLSKAHGFPTNLQAHRQARRDPSGYRLSGQCP